LTKHLYTTADVKQVREQLLKEQNNLDKCTGLVIPDKQAVLDHSHSSQYVRGVLHRQANAALGKIEHIYTRFLSYWYEGTLQDFLRQVADYLDKEHDFRFLHPGWLKRVKADYNKLSAKAKDAVLIQLGSKTGKNDIERKALFSAILLTKQHTFDIISDAIRKQNFRDFQDEK
jgi:hypothetical protein